MRPRSILVKRASRPQLESLEHKSLLSGGLSATLTTDSTVYLPGEPIHLTLTETNTSSEPQKLVIGPSDDGFEVTEGGVPVWRSNAGVVALYLELVTLQPGQSQSISSTWDGVPNIGNSQVLAPGVFTVTNQLAPDGTSATFQIDSQITYSLTTDQSDYQAGQPIQITATETNTSSQPVTIDLVPNFAVRLNGSPVWQSDSSGSVTTQTLEPGQSVVQSTTWNGIANMGALAGTNVWGLSLSASSPNVPAGLTADFSIDDPLAIDLSTPSPIVASGQPVVLTVTETNTSREPITVLDAPGTFSVIDSVTGSTVFSQSDAGPPVTVTLEPNQSLTRSATWDTDSVGTLPGIYDAYYQDGSQGAFISLNVVSLTPPVTGPPTLPFPPAISATLTTSHESYKLGGRVSISLKLKNTSDQAVPLEPNARFFVYRGTVLVGQGTARGVKQARRTVSRAEARLSAGHKKTIGLTWVARPGGHGATALKPGVYTIVASENGYSALATIRLEA